MRATISFVLLLVMLATPVTQVLAQVAQHQNGAVQAQSAVVASAVVADAARVKRSIIGVPQLDSNGSAALLLAPVALDLTPAHDSPPPLMPTPTPISRSAKTGLIVLAVLVAVGGLIAIIANEAGDAG